MQVMADQREDMPGASEVKHLEHDQPGAQPAEEVDDERRGTPAQAPEQPAQQAPPAEEQLLSTSLQASAPMADQHKDMPGASEVKHLEHDQPVAQPAEEVDDERRGTPAQAPEQPAQEALPAKAQILSTSPQASAPMPDHHEDMPGASEVKHLEHDQPGTPPAEEVDDERRGTPAQAPEQPAQQALPAKEQLLSTSPQASAPMADQHEDMPGASEVKHLEHDQPGTPPAEEVDDERLGTPAQAPEQPAQQAPPAEEQLLSTSPQASAPMADHHEDMPGASEVKHLEHDQPGTPPAEEVDDERRGTPAQAPEQPAQQALPAKEQLLSTSPQASAPMADHHEDMPGASEVKHLEHDQPVAPPAEEVDDERRGTPAQAPEQPAQQALPAKEQLLSTSPQASAPMADQHKDMPGASEVKHLEHDQPGAQPAEEVEDERLGTPAQAPEQLAQQALPAEEQLLSTLQASAPMADQHKDMPGASEVKHLEHDQPGTPPAEEAGTRSTTSKGTIT